MRKSGYIITKVGENYIQTLSLIGLIIDVALRERSWIGRTCAFGSPSISYVSDKLSKHHGLCYPSIMACDPIAEITTSVHRIPNICTDY